LSVPDERFERSWWKGISETRLAHYILYLRFIWCKLKPFKINNSNKIAKKKT
jgi:hypothetical protein